MNKIGDFLYRICEWIMRLAFVNFLWIIFTFVGMIILGFFPSTMAMFSIIRKWLLKQEDFPLFKTYWTIFKQEWFRSNVIGGILIMIGYIIYLEFSILQIHTQGILQYSKYPLLVLAIIFCLVCLYIFPIDVHFHLKLPHVFKNSLFIMLISPIPTFIMILGLMLIYYVVRILPPLLLFFGGSATACWIMWCCYQSFLAIDRKKEKYKETINP
ncbi:YesL family protein [Bacillus salitolerans]|uniref:YesL family protein n=1 Tax=Bacillus salitolerans TaxID=1437434 RepID=A0ABW4LK31_9BACI